MSRPRGERELPPPPPDDALTALVPADVDLAAGWRHEAAVPIWHGVVWGRLGRGDLAWAHFDRIRLPELGSWIAAERGRILRELGLHAQAETLELPALLHAEDAVDAAMLRVSLVADAVGMADVAKAERRLAAATAAVAALADGPRAARQRIRLGWVTAEVAYLTGRPPSTEGTARWDEAAGEPRFPPDLVHGSDFHRAKALLFAGVIRDDDRLIEAAVELAPPALLWAVHLARADRAGADRDLVAALASARVAWQAIVPPPGWESAVADTATSRRLR